MRSWGRRIGALADLRAAAAGLGSCSILRDDRLDAHLFADAAVHAGRVALGVHQTESWVAGHLVAGNWG